MYTIIPTSDLRKFILYTVTPPQKIFPIRYDPPPPPPLENVLLHYDLVSENVRYSHSMTLLQKNVLLHYDPASEIYLYSVHYDLTSENVPVYTMTPLPPGVFPWPREHQQPGEGGLSTVS